MTRYLAIWSTASIASLLVLGMTLRWIALHNLPVSESLIARGAFSLIITLIFAKHSKFSLKPKSLRKQLLRAILAGAALSLFSLSYYHLYASSVAIISNFDIPLLIILGPLVGLSDSPRVRVLAALSIVTLIPYLFHTGVNTDAGLGLLYLVMATLLLCFGYLLLQKSGAEENPAIAVLTPSLAIIVCGLLCYLWDFSGFANWNPTATFISFISGVAMFFAYYASLKLYEKIDLASAEFPALLSGLVLQILESFFLKEKFYATDFLCACCFSILVFLILRARGSERKQYFALQLPLIEQSLDFTCGAACFSSMFEYFRKISPGEMHFAKQLGSLDIGFTPIENIVELAQNYGFNCQLKRSAQAKDLIDSLKRGEVIFVTWWDEDAGHYSLVHSIENLQDKALITLMDPWMARQGKFNRMPLHVFIENWNLRGAVMLSMHSRQKNLRSARFAPEPETENSIPELASHIEVKQLYR